MCETPESRPPVDPRPDRRGASGDIHLSAADGNTPAAYFSRAAEPGGAGVVVIPARVGLVPFYKELCDRFAEAGVDAVTLDLYGRTAADDRRDERFEWQEHYETVTRAESRPQVDLDVAAAVDFLTSDAGGSPASLFTVGFCFGGSVSWWQSAVDARLSGCIGLYGAPRYVQDLIADMRAPLLVLSAGADEFISRDQVSGFEADLSKADVEFEAKVYDGAPHSFFDFRHEQHADAAADAWRRILDFLDRHS